jgi:hypothetical protein
LQFPCSIQKQAGPVAGALVTAFNQLHVFLVNKNIVGGSEVVFIQEASRPSGGYHEQLHESPSWMFRFCSCKN